jgi:hypothetical protein
MIRPHERRRQRPNSFLQASSNAVADDGTAYLTSDREAEPRPFGRNEPVHFVVGIGSPAAFHHEKWAGPTHTSAHTLELRLTLQGLELHHVHQLVSSALVRAAPSVEAQAVQTTSKRSGRSGGQPLAPLRPTARKHAHAANGRHALAEAMAALANEPARLVGPFHVSISVANTAIWRQAPSPRGLDVVALTVSLSQPITRSRRRKYRYDDQLFPAPPVEGAASEPSSPETTCHSIARLYGPHIPASTIMA